jgi:tetratricopeptide (TPR) repeat protein
MNSTETQRLDRENPWPGLTPFNEAAQEFFHGRDEVAAELFRRIRRDLLTVLYGKSGLGKTSLLNAGLFPLLRANDFLPIYVRLDFANPDIGPIAQIAAAIKDNLSLFGIDGPSPPADGSLWSFFHDKSTEFWSRRNRLITPVLVLDQFEEIFTLGHGTPAAAAVASELSALIENRPPDVVRDALDGDPDSATRYDFAKETCKIVLTLREDFLPDLEGLQQQIPSIAINRMRLTRMNGQQARDVILRSGGHLVGEGVADQIIGFVAASRERPTAASAEARDLAGLDIEPALLSIVCRELNNKRRRAGKEQITEDLLEGGAQNEIVADFYKASLAGLDPRVEIFIEDQLLTSGGYRDSRALADALNMPGVTREAIDTLVARRLLRIEERFGTQWIELTHDLLTEVIRQQRDIRREQQEAEGQRERAERAEAEAQAQATLAREAGAREQNMRRLLRRTQIALVAASVAGVLMIGAAGVAGYAFYVAKQRAEEAAEQRQLADQRAADAAQQRQLADQRAEEANANYAAAIQAASRDVDIVADQLRRNGITIDTAKSLLDSARETFGDLHLTGREDAETLRARVRLFDNLADVYLRFGDLAASLDAARTSVTAAGQLPEENGERESNLAYAHTRVGDALAAQGNLDDATTEYRLELTAMQHLLADHPDSTEYLSNLSICYDRLGDVDRNQGNLDAALGEYRASADLRTKLLAKVPDNQRWQLNLSISHRKVGDVLHDQQKTDEALDEFKAGLVLAEKLADADRNNTDAEWQRGTMHERIGEILHDKGDLEGALIEYRAEVEAMARLVARDQGNALWQRDFAMAHAMVGNLLYDQQKYPDALVEYRAELTIGQRLVVKDPNNAQWQRDLFVAYEHIGLVAQQQGDLDAAVDAFEKAAAVAKRKKAMNPTAPESNTDLTWVENKLAALRQQLGPSTPRGGGR